MKIIWNGNKSLLTSDERALVEAGERPTPSRGSLFVDGDTLYLRSPVDIEPFPLARVVGADEDGAHEDMPDDDDGTDHGRVKQLEALNAELHAIVEDRDATIDRLIAARDEALAEVKATHAELDALRAIPDGGKLSASEAVYGFAAWLTTRESAITLSAKHDAAPVADLVSKFCEANALDDPRERWDRNLIHPSESDA